MTVAARWLLGAPAASSDFLIFAVPPASHFAAFTLLSGDGHSFMAVLRAVASTVGASYPTE